MSNSTTHKVSSQQRLFDEVLAKYPSKSAALDELVTLLQVTKTSLYRKINGNSALKLSEVLLLTKHYKLSLDELLDNPSSVFNFQFVNNQTEKKEVISIADVELLEELKEKENAKLSYLGSQIPIPYLNLYPSLIYFKEYIWKRNSTSISKTDYTPIDFSAISNDDMIKYKHHWNLYASIPSSEIWDSSAFTLLIEEIRHCYDIGVLLEDDFEMLQDSLQRLVNRLSKMLQTGSKQLDEQTQNMFVYHNPTLLPTWFYIAESDSLNYFQGAFNPPSSIVSHNTRMMKNAKLRFNNQLKQCTAISKHGTRHRTKLIKTYRRKIESLE